MRSAVQALSSHNSRSQDSEVRADVFIGIATVFARAGGSENMPEILRLAADFALYEAKHLQIEPRDPNAFGGLQPLFPGV